MTVPTKIQGADFEAFEVLKAVKGLKDFEPNLDPEIQSILILPVMITAERYVENIEERLRSRYAVLSALHVAGYRPKDAEHIGYFEREIHSQTRTIPYEWFLLDPFPINSSLSSREIKKEYNAILVLWLGDEYFSNKRIEGLQALFKYIQECFKDKPQLTIKVLGPSNSTSLEEIISEALPTNCSINEFLKKMHKYLKAKEVLDGIKEDLSKKEQSHDTLKQKSNFTESTPNLTCAQKEFEKAISELETAKNVLKKEKQEEMSDNEVKFEMYSPWATADPLLMMEKKPITMSMLVKMYREVQSEDILKEEDIFKLILRHTGIALQRSIHTDHQLTDELVNELGWRDIKIGSNNSDDIILISDWDTFYGRALPLSFVTSFLEKYNEKNNQRPGAENNCSLLEKIHIFSYMRGIDGMISNANDTSNSSPKQSTASAQIFEKHSDTNYFTPAFEQPLGQVQFDYIRRLTDRIKQESSKYKIGAIGVLGNDIYDKLLILRALRDQFPGAIFFTTDLDARLYYHTELPWTRNLIVASSYGLQLHPKYQGAIPPFRSTYQTSLFVAALQALGIIAKDEIDFKGNQNRPRIFEVGNRGSYDLTPVFKGKSDSPGAKPLHPDRYDCWKNKPLKEWLFYLFFMLFLPIIVFSCLFYYNIQQTKKIGIDHRWKNYWVRFLVSCVLSFAALTVFAFISSWIGAGEPITFFDGISIWPTELLRLFSGFLSLYFLLFSVQSIILNDKEIIQFFQKSETDSNVPNAKNHTILDIFNTWKEYQASEKSKKRWIFIGIAAGAYLVAGYGFIFSCGKPLTPFRGGISLYVDKCILISSLLFMLILIMFVIHTTWLCIKFIKQVTGLNKTVNVSEIVNVRCSLENDACKKNDKECQKKYHTCLTKYDKQIATDIAGYWFKMKVIGEKTKVIGEMIKYPFLILFLLLISRHKYFDNWTWTVPLAIVIGFTTLIALGCTIILFHAAKRARQQMITQLREEMLKLINTQLPEEIDAFNDKKSKLIEQRSRSIEYVTDEIQNLKGGAFSPIVSFQNPIIMAILTPLGGMGSISLFQQLSQFLKD